VFLAQLEELIDVFLFLPGSHPVLLDAHADHPGALPAIGFQTGFIPNEASVATHLDIFEPKISK
jgi:hypothetical protein